MPPTYPRRPTCPEGKRKQSHATTPNTCPLGSPPRPHALVTKTIAHKQIPFPRGISPLRSDCRPRSGRNDIVDKRSAGRGLPRPYRRLRCESYTNVISSEGVAEVEKSPAVEGITNESDYPKYLPARLTAEKSSTVEGITNESDYPKYSPARLTAETPCVGNENNRTQTNSFSAGDFSAAFGLSSSLRSK